MNHGGNRYLPSNDIVAPGNYVMLSEGGECIEVFTTPLEAPLRIPTPTNSETTHTNHYQERIRLRDRKCLITGLETENPNRLKPTHIFPRTDVTLWIRQGYPNKITENPNEVDLGGPSKIDSLQNMITLRRDLHDAWINYEFGVDPDDNYRITSFVDGHAGIDGLCLLLDHIRDPTIRPLDELLVDHFRKCLLKHVKGTSEPAWTPDDIEDAFGRYGSIDLSQDRLWGTREGMMHLEHALADRLWDHQDRQHAD